jgi:hypothetical protein
MSIFSRSRTPDEADQARAAVVAEAETHAAPPAPPASPTPPLVPTVTPRGSVPGVVPPPAAPMYSTRRPEPAARVQDDLVDTVAERLRMAREALERAQVSVDGSLAGRVEGRMRIRAQREARRAVAPTSGARRQPAPAAPAAARAARPQKRTAFDATRAAQSGLLHLAWSWQQAGSPIRAIHAYMQVLERYPDTPAADAAVADLVELSDKLAGQGQFHTALAIYDHLEELLA